MSLSGLIVTLVLTALVLIIILAPLRRRKVAEAVDGLPASRQRERVQAYYDRALANLRDLDEDFALGKIEPSLYEQDRALWVERGVQALKALDALGALPSEAPFPQPPSGGGAVASASASASEADLDAAVEAAVRRARSQTSGSR